MLALIVTTRNGEVREVAGAAGVSAMQVIRDHGFDDLLALCEGCRSCATCHVHVDAEQLAILPLMSADEDDLLDGSDARPPCPVCRANSRSATISTASK